MDEPKNFFNKITYILYQNKFYFLIIDIFNIFIFKNFLQIVSFIVVIFFIFNLLFLSILMFVTLRN